MPSCFWIFNVVFTLCMTCSKTIREHPTVLKMTIVKETVSNKNQWWGDSMLLRVGAHHWNNRLKHDDNRWKLHRSNSGFHIFHHRWKSRERKRRSFVPSRDSARKFSTWNCEHKLFCILWTVAAVTDRFLPIS